MVVEGVSKSIFNDLCPLQNAQ